MLVRRLPYSALAALRRPRASPRPRGQAPGSLAARTNSLRTHTAPTPHPTCANLQATSRQPPTQPPTLPHPNRIPTSRPGEAPDSGEDEDEDAEARPLSQEELRAKTMSSLKKRAAGITTGKKGARKNGKGTTGAPG